MVGFWPANADVDDIVLYTDETRKTELGRLHTLRQQMAKGEGGRANVALADFVAPVGTKPDWVGGFAVTAGHGELELAAKFKADGDDYSAIWPRPSPKPCTARCAPSSGAMRPTRPGTWT